MEVPRTRMTIVTNALANRRNNWKCTPVGLGRSIPMAAAAVAVAVQQTPRSKECGAECLYQCHLTKDVSRFDHFALCGCN